jgi:hypothetical protein
VVPGHRSGVIAHGEQRGAAAADFDRDGRLDLVLTQNGAETVLLRNATARPCLRVRLEGPESNPDGIGSVLRLVSVDRVGPAREIQAGSGYWSQNSPVQLLAVPGGWPVTLEVRWPGRSEVVKVSLPEPSREVLVRYPDGFAPSQGER